MSRKVTKKQSDKKIRTTFFVIRIYCVDLKYFSAETECKDWINGYLA